MKCEKCGCEIGDLVDADEYDEEELADLMNHTQWEQYLCEGCHQAIWDDKLKAGCEVCETRPCEKGRDCWVNPWPDIMFLCYVGKRRIKEPDRSRRAGICGECGAIWCFPHPVGLEECLNCGGILKPFIGPVNCGECDDHVDCELKKKGGSPDGG